MGLTWRRQGRKHGRGNAERDFRITARGNARAEVKRGEKSIKISRELLAGVNGREIIRVSFVLHCLRFLL